MVVVGGWGERGPLPTCGQLPESKLQTWLSLTPTPETTPPGVPANENRVQEKQQGKMTPPPTPSSGQSSPVQPSALVLQSISQRQGEGWQG